MTPLIVVNHHEGARTVNYTEIFSNTVHSSNYPYAFSNNHVFSPVLKALNDTQSFNELVNCSRVSDRNIKISLCEVHDWRITFPHALYIYALYGQFQGAIFYMNINELIGIIIYNNILACTPYMKSVFISFLE